MKKRKDKSIETDSWCRDMQRRTRRAAGPGKPADPMETPVQDADDL